MNGKKLKLAKSRSTSNLKLPFDFFENHFQTLPPSVIKVYLYSLYLCTLGDIEYSEEQLAFRLNLSLSDIRQSYAILKEQGFLVIGQESGEDELVSLEDFYKNHQKEANVELKKELNDLFRTAETDLNFKKQVRFIEDIYKKELNQNDLIEIYDLLENQKVPYEVLLAAIEYSIHKNKKSFNYISKVAINWKELGLTNYESCEKYIIRENLEENELFKNLKRIFKLDRDFFDVELKYIEEWCKQNKTMDEIKKAFEATIINTGKLSFPYMNAIICNDKGEGKTAVKPTVPPRKTAMHNFSEREYDYNDIMSALRKKQNQ